MDTSSSVRRHGNLAVRIDQDERSLAVRPVGELDIASRPGARGLPAAGTRERRGIGRPRSHTRDVHRFSGRSSVAVGRCALA
jgi:acyl CoA:acetate/3-ketoacid CoA transferase alpha subunit